MVKNGSSVVILTNINTFSFKNLYDDDVDKLEHSEACVNYDLALPRIKDALQMLKRRGINVATYPGKEELLSMTKQLQQQGQTDKRHKYNADGVVRFNKVERF